MTAGATRTPSLQRRVILVVVALLAMLLVVLGVTVDVSLGVLARRNLHDRLLAAASRAEALEASCSAATCIPAIGVRSSWAASTMKRRVAVSARRAASAARWARRSEASKVSSIPSKALAARPNSVSGRSGRSRRPRSPVRMSLASAVSRSSGRSATRLTATSNSAATSRVTTPAPIISARS
ncbi:hypothetical protein A5713_12670 [Mycobacterium sp. E2497]|nr:hypothetical protein A5713_12670 [Mycobacterium sp. E2497]